MNARARPKRLAALGRDSGLAAPREANERQPSTLSQRTGGNK